MNNYRKLTIGALLIFCFTAIFILTSSVQSFSEETSNVLSEEIEYVLTLMNSERFDDAKNLLERIYSTHDLLPPETDYMYAVLLHRTGDISKTKSFLERFLNQTERNSQFYWEAIELLIDIEKEVITKVADIYVGFVSKNNTTFRFSEIELDGEFHSAQSVPNSLIAYLNEGKDVIEIMVLSTSDKLLVNVPDEDNNTPDEIVDQVLPLGTKIYIRTTY